MVSRGAAATHPQLADESACLLHRQLALLPHDALNGLEDIPGHGDIAADIDVASLLLQCFEHGLGQLLLQHVLHIFLKGEEGGAGVNCTFSAPSTRLLRPPWCVPAVFKAAARGGCLFGGACLHLAAPTAVDKRWGKQ